jgi:phosphatidylinositol alpha-1,6-mannosyltransferase
MANDLRVCTLSLWFPPPMEGGSVVYTFNLVNHLPAASTTVITAGSTTSRQFDRECAFSVLRCGPAAGRADKLRRTRIALAWVRLILGSPSRRPDVLVAADVTVAAQVALLTRRVLGIPYVIFIYSEELTKMMHNQSWSVWRRFDKWLKMRALAGAAGVVGISDYAFEQLTRAGIHPPHTIKIIPSIAPRDRHVSAAQVADVRKKLGLTEANRMVLSVGRLTERKGHDQLLRSWVAVQQEFPNVKLLIVGRGEEEAKLRLLAKQLELDDSVVFTGFTRDADLPGLYESCDVFVMPHRELPNGDTEGFGIVFLEANSHGKPAIGGMAGGVRDAIVDGKTGLIVDGNDVAAISEAIRSILRDSSLARTLGDNGQRRVLEELCPRVGGARLYGFLQEVVANPTCRPVA